MKQTVYMNLKMFLVLAIGSLLFTKVHSQATTFQNLYFIKNGQHPLASDKDYKPRKEGFFIYRNCAYEGDSIGLWNVTRKRRLPLINCSLKS